MTQRSSLPDADVAKVAEKLFWASFYNAGQVCIAAKRIYIHEDIYDELSAAIAAYASAVKVGDGAEQGTAIGPIQNKQQYNRVLELIADAKDKGYKFLVGGDHDPSIPGYFVPVTVLDNPPEDARIVAEEQFGPVMPLMKFSTVDEVISRANASDYGSRGFDLDEQSGSCGRSRRATGDRHCVDQRVDAPWHPMHRLPDISSRALVRSWAKKVCLNSPIRR